MPSVKEEKPKNEEKYKAYLTDTITVYIDKEIKFKRNTVHMDLRKFFFTYEITIDGVDIAY
ncbi:hypothetical protein [Tindallia californiensis]|uniref:Uncharacterized protein n=1 Tax=Tindallia californiensis TaxID=159292 RepID=A0A1H3J3X4_9FIRM|nr:hypothetical protein [Tindallia californiensis]SDY34720.1 hypothetical protein SAMN05192546_101412 [Tindallia californiensis]